MSAQPSSLTVPSGLVQRGFRSILSDGPDADLVEDRPPDCFADLNLDQLVGSILVGRDEYDLSGFFFTPLHARRSVEYRQEVFRDLEQQPVGACLTEFGEEMREVRRQLARAGRLRFPLQRQSWHLTAALRYISAVRSLGAALQAAPLSSTGLDAFVRFLTGYLSSPEFGALADEGMRVQGLLDDVTYRLRVHGGRVQISLPVAEEDDYAADVTATFARFQQGPVRSYRSSLGFYEEMNHVEQEIASRVALLYPDVFAALAGFHRRHGDFISGVVARFDREVQFYLAYLEFVRRVRAAGLAMCYPQISTTTPLRAVDAYDAALADKLTGGHGQVVPNTFELFGSERIWVVTGPNQGGKTTFARMVGQVHYLASLGVLVPGSEVRLPLLDRIFTHFERGENLQDLTGKLDDDLVRIRDILRSATADSLLILNEIFTSTSVEDAVWLATRVFQQVMDLGCRCVCVTFLDELAAPNASTVSMVATIARDDPASRTFRIVRRKADGRAYAEAVAERYGLTARALKKRLSS